MSEYWIGNKVEVGAVYLVYSNEDWAEDWNGMKYEWKEGKKI